MIEIPSIILSMLAIVVSLAATAASWGTYRRLMNTDRRAQADLIATWVGGDGVVVSNGSPQPVYDVVVTGVYSHGAAPKRGEDFEPGPQLRQTISSLAPGTWTLPMQWDGGMRIHPGAEIAFTDQHEKHWVRRATGRLERLSTDQLAHFNVDLPPIWASPTAMPPLPR